MKRAEIAFFRPFYISFSHLQPFLIFPYFNLLVFSFTFHILCVSTTYSESILHFAFTLLSHLILPLAPPHKPFHPYTHTSKSLHPKPKMSAFVSKPSVLIHGTTLMNDELSSWFRQTTMIICL